MTTQRRPSQAAIARSLKMSLATVSLVLRGGTGPSPATRQKVLEAAQRMGYRPNSLVQSIRSGKSRMIGVFAQPHDSYWREICYGIHDRLIESDHVPMFLWNNDRLEYQRSAEYSLQQIHRLVDRWVDGVIAWPFFAELYAAHLEEFQSRNIPLVTIDHLIANADVVKNDEPQMAGLMTSHLAGLGHRNLLVISGPSGIEWADERCAGVKSSWARIPGSRIHECRIGLRHSLLPEELTRIREALTLQSDITAVVACTDWMARGVYQVAAQLKWEIPGRLSVISVADLDFAALMAPPLTTVRQNGYEIGRKAAQVQLERGAGLLSGPARCFKISGELVLRDSTAVRRN